MLTETLSLILQLPPLAFGPVMPPPAFEVPRELVCAIHELGRPRSPLLSHASGRPIPSIDSKGFKPVAERYLVNRAVDTVLVLSALYVGRGSWDDKSWSLRTWQATGGIAPISAPPLPPPVRSPGN